MVVFDEEKSIFMDELAFPYRGEPKKPEPEFLRMIAPFALFIED